MNAAAAASGPRMTRRHVLGLAAAGGAAALGALAGLPRPAAAQSTAKPAPELVVGFSIDPGHMDPRVEAGVPGWSIFHHMHDPMIWRDERERHRPALAGPALGAGEPHDHAVDLAQGRQVPQR